MLLAGIEKCEHTDFQFYQDGTNVETARMETGHTHHQGDKIPQEWNQSTVDVFSNPRLLKNIRKTTRSMTINCNAGTTQTDMIGEMPGYPGEVWYNPKGIANILSVANVKKHHRVTYDSNNEDGFIVHKNDGTQRQFKESEKGLFYLDTSETRTKETVLVNTVDFVNRQEPKLAIKPSDYDKSHANLQHTALTQYSIKKGLKVFGEAGADAVVKEMEQLDETNVIEPRHAHMLTRQEKRAPSST